METLEHSAVAPADEGYASIGALSAWAAFQMGLRKPDVVIGGDYLRRWWIVPRNPSMNVYLHEFLRSDDDRALHDHPWDNSSFLLSGEYREHTPEGVFHRKAGDFVARSAASLHRIELIDGQPTVSLFMTGPKVREWGFACPQGWVHWQTFLAAYDGQQVSNAGMATGRGCGA